MSKVTINDIARAAGVAKSTVSKVLNDAPTIPEATKQKIRAIMSELNYIPSSIATQLARQSSFNIGLLVDLSRKRDFLNQSFYNIIGGIESVVGELDYELTIGNAGAKPGDGGGFMNRLVRNKKVDGLVMDNSILTAPLAAQLNELRFPFVSIGGLTGVDTFSWVDIDNSLGAEMIIDHLVRQGYSRFAFVGGEPNEPIFTNRFAGFSHALGAGGKPVVPAYVKNGPADEANGYRLTRELLALKEPPDALVCMSNFAAYGALQAVRESGLALPDAIGIVTFDDYPLAPYTSPPLTSLHLDTFKLGVTAGTMLKERIADPDHPVETILLAPELIERESTRRRGR